MVYKGKAKQNTNETIKDLASLSLPNREVFLFNLSGRHSREALVNGLGHGINLSRIVSYETSTMRHFETIRLMDYVEAWFDYHPEPENIEFLELDLNGRKVTIYWANHVHDTFMLKITCKNARQATVLSRRLQPISHGLALTQILIGNKLFLFTDRRF